MTAACATVRAMPYAFVQDIAASWHNYGQIAAALVEPAPAGLILHAAGPTDEGVRIIAIWENEPAWQRFQTEGLAAAIACLRGPARPEPTFRDLHTAHLVVGERGKRGSLQSQAQENEQ
jgi:hypothetical protein